MATFDPVSVKANRDLERSLAIPIISREGETIGRLCCVDQTRAADQRVVSALTKWRNKNSQAFLTQFEATETRTASWLSNVVIPSRDRMLFMIIDADDELIGNVGIANLNGESAELDNVLRGEISRFPGIAAAAVRALLKWAFRELELKTVYLNVFANNDKAVGLYKSLGFLPAGERRLSVVKTSEETRYLIESDDGQSVSFGYLCMIHEHSEAADQRTHHSLQRGQPA